MSNIKVVFFGSGPVAAQSLEKLMQYADIEAVITKPRASHHHGSVPVIDLAEVRKLPIHTASNRRELDELISNTAFQSDIAVLIDFGIIVSDKVIGAFPHGIVNSHFSLLPKLRGADPITWSIISGDAETGVSLMLVDTGMDTGRLIAQQKIPLNNTETTPSLTTKLIDLSDTLLQKYLPLYLSGEIEPNDQPHAEQATYSRKLQKSDGTIDWHEPAVLIERKIRAFLEWPKSRTNIGGIDVIICSSEVTDEVNLDPGEVKVFGKRLIIGAADKCLEITSLKPSGKKEMPASAFLSGYKL